MSDDMKKEMISCLECKYGRQIGEKVFHCYKQERNVILQICTKKRGLKK